MAKQCVIDKCENLISERSQMDMCPTCRGGLHYWHKKRPAEILERRRKLTMYHSRLDTMVDDDEHVIPRRRRA